METSIWTFQQGRAAREAPIHLLGTFWSVSKVNRHEGLGANLGCFCPTHSQWEESRRKQTTAGRSQSAPSHNLGMKWTEYTKHSHKDEI